MAILFILMMIGYLCQRLGYINDEVSRRLSSIVINIANPAVLISGCITEKRLAINVLANVFIVVILVFAVLIIAAQFLPIILGVPKTDIGIYRAMTVFSNMGFMGIPMVNALYGSDAIIYIVIFTIPFNVLIYTYGVIVITRENHFSLKKACSYIVNVGVCASVLALVIYLTGYTPPLIIRSSLNYIGNLVSPLSMMIVGASFAGMHVRKMMVNYKLLIFAFIKMLVIPIISIFILKQFVADTQFLGVCMVVLATPIGTMTAMLAQQNDVDSSIATEGIALTTLMSVLTIPLVSMIAL